MPTGIITVSISRQVIPQVFKTASVMKYYIPRYEGGAHEYNQTFYLNFQPGKRRKEFIAQQYLHAQLPVRTDRLLQDELVRLFNSKDIKELSEKGILNTTDFYITSNFKLGKDSMEFLYNVYEIAPYDIRPHRILTVRTNNFLRF